MEPVTAYSESQLPRSRRSWRGDAPRFPRAVRPAASLFRRLRAARADLVHSRPPLFTFALLFLLGAGVPQACAQAKGSTPNKPAANQAPPASSTVLQKIPRLGSDENAASLAALDHVKLLMQQGKAFQAEMAVRDYLKAHPDSGRAHFLLGYILFDEIHVKFIDQEKKKGVGFRYNDDVNNSLIEFRNTKARQSLAQFSAGAKHLLPGAFDFKIVALDYVLLKDNIAADKWLTLSLKMNPRDASGWYYLGRTKYSESQFPGAIEAFEHCLELTPKNVQAEYNAGLSYEALGQKDAAIQAYRHAISWQAQSLVKDPEPFIFLARVYLGENQPAKAVPYLQQAVQIAPQSARAHEQLGKAYSLLRQLPEAQQQLEKAVQLSPGTAPLHCMLGQIYRQEKKLAQAKDAFGRCAALQKTAGPGAPMM